MPEARAFGECADDIVVDELEDLLLLGVLFQGGVLDVGVDHDEVVAALPREGLVLVVLVGGHVF